MPVFLNRNRNKKKRNAGVPVDAATSAAATPSQQTGNPGASATSAAATPSQQTGNPAASHTRSGRTFSTPPPSSAPVPQLTRSPRSHATPPSSAPAPGDPLLHKTHSTRSKRRSQGLGPMPPFRDQYTLRNFPEDVAVAMESTTEDTTDVAMERKERC